MLYSSCHYATPVDVENTFRLVVELLCRDPVDQRFLERLIVRRATRPVAALPLQYVAPALYLHQHLLRSRPCRENIRIELLIEDSPGPRPCWQDPVLETLYDQRG